MCLTKQLSCTLAEYVATFESMPKGKLFDTVHKETCVLVGLATQHQKREQLKEYLDELAFLVTTANAETKRTFIQGLTRPDVKTFVGSGKLQEIKEYVEEEKIDMIVFDDELSGSQIRNIEEAIPEVKILDRPNLILTFSHKELALLTLKHK